MAIDSNTDWKDLIDVDAPLVGPITDETIGRIKQNSAMYGCGDMRTATGRIWATEKYEERRALVLATPLP